MNNQQTLAALAALSQLISAAQAPAPAPAPAQQDDLDGDTPVSTGHHTVVRFRRTLTVFANKVDPKTGKKKVVDGSPYTVKIGDHVSVARRHDLIKASDLVQHTSDGGTKYWSTPNIWEVEVAFITGGKAWIKSAKDTGERYAKRSKEDLDDVQQDDLDVEEPGKSEAKPEAGEPEAVPAFEEAL